MLFLKQLINNAAHGLALVHTGEPNRDNLAQQA